MQLEKQNIHLPSKWEWIITTYDWWPTAPGVNSVVKKHLLGKLLIKTQIYYLPVFNLYTKMADGNVMMENAAILINKIKMRFLACCQNV